MKKFFYFVVMLVAFAFSAESVLAATQKQEKEPSCQGFITNKFKDNWELSAGVGPLWMLETGSQNFGSTTGVSGFIAANKWFHPVFGVRLGVEFADARYKSIFGEQINSTLMYFHPDFMVNLSNWIGGYRKDRLYSAVVNVGAGLAFVDLGAGLDDNQGSSWNGMEEPARRRPHEYALNFGLQNRFRISDAVNIDLTVEYLLARANLFPVYTAASSDRFNALRVFAGVTYRFNRRDWDRAGATEAEAKAMLDRLHTAEKEAADAQAENEKLRALADEQAKALDAAAAQAADRDAALAAANDRLLGIHADELLFYACDRSLLTKNNKVRLNRLAEKIKNDANKDYVYSVCGYADPETGSKNYNLKLAEKRARVVYDYLVERGVDAARLTYKGCGVDAVPFDKLTFEQNRAVVVF
ncbi:MAG: OmpA family protein [Alistipes sp.]|nr:OmpA family protein [Alistipes sp.]